MAVTLDEEKFQKGHQIFRAYLEDEREQPFITWEHPYVQDELEYKRAIRTRALEELQSDRWDRWRREKPGRILEAVAAASRLKISENLVTTGRYEPEAVKSPERALEQGGVVARRTAEKLYAFFREPEGRPFPTRFDELADHLRAVQLPCRGAWFAYLAYLYDDDTYFPMRPRSFEALLQTYGNPKLQVQGKITWRRYRHLLQLATLLTDRLAEMPCGEPTTLQVQTYMYVIGSQLLEKDGQFRAPTGASGSPAERSRKELLEQRMEAARKRQRRGLDGELHVLAAEQRRLRDAGRADLAEQVTHRAAEDPRAPYDIESFTVEGDRRLIEVKTTKEKRERDAGFYLTENKRALAAENPIWRLYRVWNVEDKPEIGRVGNILVKSGERNGWQLNPSSWYCCPP